MLGREDSRTFRTFGQKCSEGGKGLNVKFRHISFSRHCELVPFQVLPCKLEPFRPNKMRFCRFIWNFSLETQVAALGTQISWWEREVRGGNTNFETMQKHCCSIKTVSTCALPILSDSSEGAIFLPVRKQGSRWEHRLDGGDASFVVGTQTLKRCKTLPLSFRLPPKRCNKHSGCWFRALDGHLGATASEQPTI